MTSPQPNQPVSSPRQRIADAGRAHDWLPVFATFVFACLLSIAAFPDAWLAMVHVWSNSDTYAHGYIALPCAAWMIWRRHNDWAPLPRQVWWPAALGLIGCGIVWLVGRLGGVASLEQFGAVSVIPATVLLLSGPAIAWALAFPLAFLFFAVPVGEFLTPIMMDYTADATVAALRWSGVPVYREGLHFMIPTGRWSVVEACSGLRYLIASLALGMLYAYLQFRTLKYRLAFVALAIVVPIIANWIRAYIIVMLGHLSDMRIATGADHLIYGWLFFGLVMALLFWIGSRWREPPAARSAAPAAPADDRADGTTDDTTVTPARAARRTGVRAMRGAAVAAALATLMWRPLAGELLDATRPVDAVSALRAAVDVFPPGTALDFAPRYADANGSIRAARRVDGTPVEVHAFYFARQHESQEMIHSKHSVVRVDDDTWAIRSRQAQSTPWGTVFAYRLGRAGADDLLVWHWYAVGSTQTASAYRAKAATAWSLATGRGDHSLALVLATPVRLEAGAGSAEAIGAAQRRLANLANALQPAIGGIARGRAPRAGSLAAVVPPPASSSASASASTSMPAVTAGSAPLTGR